MPDYGGQYNLTQPTLADKQVAALQFDVNGNLKTTVGVSASALGKAEDAAHASGDTGVFVLGVRNDAGTVLTSADGDYSPIAVDSSGQAKVYVASVFNGASGLAKSEDAAHASGDYGVFALGVRNDNATTNPTSANGDYSQISVDIAGRIIISQATNIGRISSAAATTNATSFKASAGTTFGITAYNASAAVKFIKLYNKASAPTVGTDTPFMTFAVGPSQSLQLDFGTGVVFSLGIAIALTGLAADADTTALAAGDIVGLNLQYI